MSYNVDKCPFYQTNIVTYNAIILTVVHIYFIISSMAFKWLVVNNNKPSMRRRLTFATLIMINQMLLIALAIAWIVHMAIIALNGSVFFIEKNSLILWGEISAMVIITLFAICVLAMQVIRLGERRRDRDNRS